MTTFPSFFWWGTAASSTQSEGAAAQSDWKRWENLGQVPPSGDGNGFGARYGEDLRLYAAHGLIHHRLSIEWARIEPEEGVRDREAIEHYLSMLRAARDVGIAIWVCLHHFTLPVWFADGLGGFLNEKAARYYWPRHVDFVAETFGDLVFGWMPINEPGWYALGGFLAGTMPPGLRDIDKYRFVRAEIHRANHDAARRLRSGGQPVATVHGLMPIYPTDSSAEAREAVQRADASIWGSWLKLLRDPALMEDFDLIGFSYYSAAGIGPDGMRVPWPPDAPLGKMGYVPWVDGLREVLHRLADELPGHPLVVSECGLGTADDRERVAYLRSALAIVGEAIRAGIDVRGFFHWTGVDNYEWHRGFDVPFGIFDRDRNPRPSAALLAGVARTGAVPSLPDI